LEVFILSELAEVANFARCWWVVATFAQISAFRKHSEQALKKKKREMSPAVQAYFFTIGLYLTSYVISSEFWKNPAWGTFSGKSPHGGFA
jgi:hypothetical protein